MFLKIEFVEDGKFFLVLHTDSLERVLNESEIFWHSKHTSFFENLLFVNADRLLLCIIE